MPTAAEKNLCLRQAEWVSHYCLLGWEPWNSSTASAKKRSDIEREEFLYICNFRLCVSSSLTHQSFLNGVKLLIVGKFIIGEKGMVIHLEFCSTIFRLWLLLPCRCCLHSFALTSPYLHAVHLRRISFVFQLLNYLFTMFWLEYLIFN